MLSFASNPSHFFVADWGGQLPPRGQTRLGGRKRARGSCVAAISGTFIELFVERNVR